VRNIWGHQACVNLPNKWRSNTACGICGSSQSAVGLECVRLPHSLLLDQITTLQFGDRGTLVSIAKWFTNPEESNEYANQSIINQTHSNCHSYSHQLHLPKSDIAPLPNIH
jgi:hypothetical protein